ncbi:AAA family ATPase [Microvirga tunisiensis]|uniref:AAA family ATPase n=1 Tax=Microvirga tunisiensis TaxID=2108360 RepID=UPI00192D2424|nr:AAA family ATPase [Microvirga tunisiensis]
MKLIGFRVQNFRSIADSGFIKLGDLTSLVGRNESGKSNLLLALHSLNPPDGRKVLSPIKDFPRDRRLDDCTDETEVVSSSWELTETETQTLTELLGEASHVTEVVVGRRYGKTNLWISLPGARAPVVADKDVKAGFRKLDPVITAEVDRVPEDKSGPSATAWEELKKAGEDVSNVKAWAARVEAKAKTFRSALGQAGVILTDAADELLAGLEEKAAAVTGYDKACQKARDTVAGWLPLFVYVADFPELKGHQDIGRFMQRRSEGQPLTEAEENFEKLAKVADFSAEKLNALWQAGDHETRNQLLNRAGALVSKEIRRLWKDRSLKVRFNIDGAHLDTLISDPNSTYDVEVNLDDRSRGFRWFFWFYISFAADTDGGQAQGASCLMSLGSTSMPSRKRTCCGTSAKTSRIR